MGVRLRCLHVNSFDINKVELSGGEGKEHMTLLHLPLHLCRSLHDDGGIYLVFSPL